MPQTPSLAPGAVSQVTAVASTTLIGVSLMVLVGWTFDLPLLKGLGLPITMKANAAIGLLACALALRTATRVRPAAVFATRALATLVGAIGFLTLTEHLVGWQLGIDELLFVEAPGAAATASPGRMGPNSSMSLTLAGIALWCLSMRSRRATVWAQIIASVMAVVALVPLAGYIYGARELYAVARVTGISLHMGASLLVLSIGLLAARPDIGPMAALASDGPHGLMARRLLLPAIVIPLVLGYVRVAGERRGWYDAPLGASMFAVTVIVLLSVTIWRTAVALERSNTARRFAEDALTETEGRFQSMADHAPVLIWVEEGGGRVWFNRAWREFTGMRDPADDWTRLVHPDDRSAADGLWSTAHRSGDAYSHQYRLRRADGAYAWVLETASPRVPGRGSAGYVGSCVDVTEMRHAEQERETLLTRERAARERAERADRSKDEFIATLSHELRTPLNAILGWIQMLQQGTVPESRRAKGTDAIARNATALARLIEDLLDTSRIAAGHLELVTAPVDLATIARSAVESVLPTATGKRVDVRLAASGVPIVHGDAQRLQQVILNLLSNAIKFSPDGGRVDVSVAVVADAVTVSVRDEGDGIDPAFMPHLFDRFTQADSSPARARGGLGLGLYIAQRLMVMHGGSLHAHSEGLGRGAVFTMQLPSMAGGLPADAEDAIAQVGLGPRRIG